MRRAAAVLALAALLPAALPAQRTIRVAPGAAVASLRAALALAAPGDTIRLAPGTYPTADDTVRVPRLTIAGDPGAILDGGGRAILVLRADGVAVRGLVFRHVASSFIEDRAALKADSVAGCTVADNRFEGTFFGVYVARSRDCRIERNVVRGTGPNQVSTGNAIHLWNSAGIVVRENDVARHRDGIFLEFNRHARVERNRSEGNWRYGLHFMFSDSCAYADNEFRRNGAGVAVMYSKHVDMRRNRFTDNEGPAAYGLLLKDITDSRMEGNEVRRNTVGLHVEGASRVTVVGNVLERNGWALRLLGDAEANHFEGNTFAANTFDVATNGRTSTSIFEANYWDAYRGYDLDRDGYGDVPFRPVRLFAVLVQRHPPSLILQRSVFTGLLDLVERVLPVLTPETLVDARPRMRAGA